MSRCAEIPFDPVNGAEKYTEGPFYPIFHQSEAPKLLWAPSPPNTYTFSAMAVCFSQASRCRSNRHFSPALTDASFESQAGLFTDGLRLAAKTALRSAQTS